MLVTFGDFGAIAPPSGGILGKSSSTLLKAGTSATSLAPAAAPTKLVVATKSPFVTSLSPSAPSAPPPAPAVSSNRTSSLFVAQASAPPAPAPTPSVLSSSGSSLLSRPGGYTTPPPLSVLAPKVQAAAAPPAPVSLTSSFLTRAGVTPSSTPAAPSVLSQGARDILASSPGPIVVAAPPTPIKLVSPSAPPTPSVLSEGAREILTSTPVVADAPAAPTPTRKDATPFENRAPDILNQQPSPGGVIDQAQQAVQRQINEGPYYVTDSGALTAAAPAGVTGGGGGGGGWPGDPAPVEEAYVEPTIIPGVPNMVLWGGLAAVGLVVAVKVFQRR